MEALILYALVNSLGIFGETQALLKRAMTLNWTSDDGETAMKAIVQKWDSTDTSDMDPFSILEFCKTILNLTIRAVELDLASNKRWKSGSEVITVATGGLSLFNPLNLVTATVSAKAAEEFETCQAEDERLLEDLRSTLSKY